jgi:hypothetical protein
MPNKGSFKKGKDPRRNVKGRPEGKKNYETLRREAIIELAKRNKTTPEEIELMIHLKSIGEALKGNFQFYKDDMDRTYGQAKGNIDLTSKGDKLEGIIFEVINKKDEVENANEQGSTEESESTGEPEDQNNIERGVEQVN